MESRWTFESSKGNYRGQNSMAWRVTYIIKNLLKFRCLKWARMTHLDIWNTSYGQKKGRESNWQFDSWPLKVKNRPDSLACRWRAAYRWKALDESYNFFLRFHLNRMFAHKVMGPQSCESPNVGNFGTCIWESRDKMSFGCEPRGEAHSIL
jgi:hypothetical protein